MLPPAGPEAQALTARLQQYITDHYYTCTKQILQCLGQMYTAGDSMTQNIAAGGPGTAEFAAQAIQYFCPSLKWKLSGRKRGRFRVRFL